jgi:hypothetical protein
MLGNQRKKEIERSFVYFNFENELSQKRLHGILPIY